MTKKLTSKTFLIVSSISLLGIFSFLAYLYGLNQFKPNDQRMIAELQTQLNLAKEDLLSIRHTAKSQLNALALQAGKQQAQLLRIEALGERLVQMGHLNKDEFDFTDLPAVGGLENSHENTQKFKTIGALLDLDQKIEKRQYQLNMLEKVLMQQDLDEISLPSGRPVLKGYISSKYGRRVDPKTGEIAYHHGIDFAGNKVGSPVIAVASGIVIRSERVNAYGNLVEIRHPNGYTTRYAHNKKNLVKKGDIVHKNQTIAYVGSTGRSTGAHVHFEVRKNNKVINPAEFINKPQ